MRRSTKWLVGLTAVAVIGLLLVAAGPKSSESGGCLFCGRTRYEAWMFGVKISDRVRETEASAWVDGMHPSHTNHLWGTSSVMHKGWGFRAVIGCGGVGAGGVAQIYLLRTEYGEARAREFLDKYHSHLSVDRASLHKFLRTEFDALLTTNGAALVFDTIDALFKKLNSDPMWPNGEAPFISLSSNATPKDVVASAVKAWEFDTGHIKTFEIVEVRKTPGCSAVLIQSDLGRKILLFRYEQHDKTSFWWTRFYDAPKEAEPRGAVAIFPAVLGAQTAVTETDSPGTLNTSVIYSDDSFLFLARNHGGHGGHTEPGFFVHSKAHNRWLRIVRLSTKDAKFGRSHSDDPEENMRLMKSSVGWNFTAYTNKAWIDLPLKTSGSIAFPDKIELDASGDRYRLSFFTSWKIQSAVTILYVSRRDLIEKFDKITKP